MPKVTLTKCGVKYKLCAKSNEVANQLTLQFVYVSKMQIEQDIINFSRIFTVSCLSY